MPSSNTPPPSNWGLHFSFFLRAIGIKPGFRRTGPSTLLNLFFVAGVGVVSGECVTNFVEKRFCRTASRDIYLVLCCCCCCNKLTERRKMNVLFHTGIYIFKDPLDGYWREKRAEEQRLLKQGSGEGTSAPSSATAAGTSSSTTNSKS